MSRTSAAFVPPHCPRRDCRFHASGDGWRWIRYGSFTRQASPHRIPRFRCGHCGHTFSEQTFDPTYWLKRPDVLRPTAYRLLTCSGYRQIAREAKCSPTTVGRHAARLGRLAILKLCELLPDGPLLEPVVCDGFESFALSQFFPLHLNLVVGAQSHYVYGLTHSPLRRKGRMSEGQKRRREALEAEHGRPDPRAIEHGMAEALRLAAPLPQGLVVRSDEHGDYPRALKRLAGYAVLHERTNSREARTASNPLFPVNRLDLQLRHNSANHKRETIAFSKRHQSVIERAAWLILWQNVTKPFSERHGGGTPAMRAGILERPLSIPELLSRRLFPDRVGLPPVWQRYYRGEVRTAPIANERRHQLKLAY